jgi:hypothetical protein
MPDLTFTQPHPGGRILLMLGQHQVGAVFPPVGQAQIIAGPWRWTFWLNTNITLSREGCAKTEQGAKNALLAAARDWLRKAGVE